MMTMSAGRGVQTPLADVVTRQVCDRRWSCRRLALFAGLAWAAAIPRDVEPATSGRLLQR